MIPYTSEELQDVAKRLADAGTDVVRVGYSDLIGTERSRDVLVSNLPSTLSTGLSFCRSVFGTSPQGDTVDIDGGRVDGLPDVIAVPDLATLQAVPWERGVAHCIADLNDPGGFPAPESPRHVLRRAVEQFAGLELHPIVGPELEFFLLERDPLSPRGWRRYGDAKGNVYVSGLKGDPDNFQLRTLRLLGDYGLEAVAANHEYSSGQFELNLWHSDALDAADRAFRFKSAIKELARSEDKLATFMAKPFNLQGGSGFHLHFSATTDDGDAAFDGGPEGEFRLSKKALSAIGGILAHAPALSALTNPTINSYKRFGPDTMAPWLVDWGLDNRSAMVRIPPERGRATRLELRLGDATANPYLAIAGLISAAYLGIRDGLAPPMPLEGYGYDPAKADRLPGDLGTALDALEADTDMGQILGSQFVSTFVRYKRDELQRFSTYVTDWEFAEYAYHL